MIQRILSHRTFLLPEQQLSTFILSKTFFADSFMVILKEYLLAMTSILIFKHFVKNPHCIMLGHS